MDNRTCCKGLQLIIMDFEMPVMNGLEVILKNIISIRQQKNYVEWWKAKN